MILLDGSSGEGGGQIVRTALALSMLTGEPFRVTNIRKNRPDAGLKAQHVHCIKALLNLSASKADGVEIGSTELLFIPGKLTAKNLTIDIGTAGSITLLLQAVLLPCMFAQRSHTLTLIGGTDTQWSMPIDYFSNVLIPQYRRFAGLDIKLFRRGYYPKGLGHVEITIRPDVKRNEFDTFDAFKAALRHKSFSLVERGELVRIRGISHASANLAKSRVAERSARAAEQLLTTLSVPIQIDTTYSETPSNGSGITLWAIFSPTKEDIDAENPIRIGADELGSEHIPAEEIGTKAANKLLAQIKSKAPVDAHLADNLIPLMALCPSAIRVSEISSHTKTNIMVAQKFVKAMFSIKENLISS